RQLAETRDAYKKYIAELQDGFPAVKEAADAARLAEKAQEDYNKRIQDAITLAQTPHSQKTSARIRACGASAHVAHLTASALVELDAAEKAKEDRAKIEQIFSDMGNSIENSLTSAIAQGFGGGVKSARDFGNLILQMLGNTFQQLTQMAMKLVLQSL